MTGIRFSKKRLQLLVSDYKYTDSAFIANNKQQSLVNIIIMSNGICFI